MQAGGPVDMSRCKSAEFTHGQVSIAAGEIKGHPEPMTTDSVYHNGVRTTVCKLSVKEPWLRRALTGTDGRVHARPW